jgi:hypothetical protein
MGTEFHNDDIENINQFYFYIVFVTKFKSLNKRNLTMNFVSRIHKIVLSLRPYLVKKM